MSDEYENETEKMIAATIDAAEVVRDPLEELVRLSHQPFWSVLRHCRRKILPHSRCCAHN